MFPAAPTLRRSLTALALCAGVGLCGSPVKAAEAEAALPAFEGVPEFSVTATAYTSGPESTGKRPGDPQYGITYSGTRARQGRTIAVDPSLIPLGSLVYIHELEEERIAEDIGGAVRGRRIDLYMNRVPDALQWGVRRVRIHVFPKI